MFFSFSDYNMHLKFYILIIFPLLQYIVINLIISRIRPIDPVWYSRTVKYVFLYLVYSKYTLEFRNIFAHKT